VASRCGNLVIGSRSTESAIAPVIPRRVKGEIINGFIESRSRRKFIKTASLGGAALAASPAWGRILGANDRINIALIGVGCRGNDHLDLLLKHREIKPDIEIVAICDTYQKRLSMALRKAPGAKTYGHHQDVLQRTDIDAIFIATPDHWHAPITLGAMESGKDVMWKSP